MSHNPLNSIDLFFEALKSGMLINARTPQEVEQINHYIDEQKHLTKSFDEAYDNLSLGTNLASQILQNTISQQNTIPPMLVQ